MKSILAIFKKEFLILKRDFRLRSLALIVPIIQFIIFNFAATLDVRDIKIAIFDQDNSYSSREVISKVLNCGYFKLTENIENTRQIDDSILNGVADVVLVFPSNFEQNVLSKTETQVQIIINGCNTNIALIAEQYLSMIISKYSSNILLNNISNNTFSKSPGSIILENRIWYNPDLNSRWFLLPGIICLALLVGSAISSALSIVKERELGTFEQLIVTPVKPIQIIIGKLSVYLITSLIDFVFILFLSYYLFDVPIKGNILQLLLVTIIYLLTTLSIGLLISTIAKSQQQAVFITAFFVLPPFVYLSGFAFSIESMPEWIQIVTYIIPLRYFLEIIRSIFLKGSDIFALWQQVFALTIILGVSMFLAIKRFKQKLE